MNNKKSYALRVDETNFEKLKVIAETAHRSINAQIEFLISECINAYEAEHNEIKVELD